jgi:peptidoglycan/LPS O-acetylase OafA/YrhL
MDGDSIRTANMPACEPSHVVNSKNARDNNFNLIRLVLATVVILGHSYEMAWNGRSHEPFAVLTHTSTSLGDAAVAAFFLISGFLILKSLLQAPQLGTYLRKRLLRIVPGYLVASLLSTVVVGLATWHSLQFFRHLTLRYPASLLLLDSPITPPVFPGKMWDFVDGSLWSIKYEFRCYLLVALVGMAGFFRSRMPLLALTVASLACAFIPAIQQHLVWHRWLLALGDPIPLFRLTAAFLCGGCFFLFWRPIPGNRRLCVFAFACMVPMLFHERTVLPGLLLFGGYVLFCFAFAKIRVLNVFKHAPDLSYGVYLYGWPVQALLTWNLHPQPLVTFVATMAVTVPLAWLSWHVVERPALMLRPKSSVPPPDLAETNAS